MPACETAMSPDRRAKAIASLLGADLLAMKRIEGLKGSFVAEWDGSTSVSIERVDSTSDTPAVSRWSYTVGAGGEVKTSSFSFETGGAYTVATRREEATDAGALDRFLVLVSRA